MSRTSLNRYQRFAYRILGEAVKRSARTNVHLRLSLQKAHIYLRPEVYLAYSYMNMVLALASTATFVLILWIIDLTGLVDVPKAAFLILLPVPLVLAFTIYLLTFVIPDIQASSRARDIDARLPYAINYISTMASAGVTPEKVFASLADQPIYGEVANEAAWISRDLRFLGKDLINAMMSAIDRSPSLKFQDFIQGAITAISSGEDLKHYFLSKSEQFVYENRQDQKKYLESLGVLAEAYVTVVVAGPVFLIVLMSVMLMFGGDSSNMLSVGYMLVLVMIPLAQAGFAATIKFITPEA